ncbi:hypothetical protein [Burkholderia sp. MSMB1078WGS]|uniref:hypothetical protein n=1 Tax=Burkholderia sp. MSMB1078WGS TaxID=1637900 RepID=UPI0009E8D792|nr:hypothetical protein [Burkholderia sp. MSMB1078WGS]
MRRYTPMVPPRRLVCPFHHDRRRSPFALRPPFAALQGALNVALSAAAFGAMAIVGRYAYAAGVDATATSTA